MPDISTLILAAKAIPDSLDAATLCVFSRKIITGLAERRLHAVSYACDGTETERNVQRLIISQSDSQITHTIEHPTGAQPGLTIVLATHHGFPIVMIQDNKHGLKTARNNLFSGARLLVAGNYTMCYQDVRDLAFRDDSPLYIRDVEKLDRQDDNAATRLFSATTLEYLITHYPERRGLIVYLFVLADLHDAYQNRHIAHVERVRMVLRTRYFLDIWKAFLASSQYAMSRHFISREAADIMNILNEGFLGLVFIYRDHSDGKVFPLLPWLHSSEMCEHVFGECRKLVKDFTYLDFLFMVPRLSVLLRTAVAFKHSSSPKERAAGYAHTYYDMTNIDLARLAVFPTDADIKEASQQAYAEAQHLWHYLGVTPADVMLSATQSPPVPKLPGIDSWFVSGADPVKDSALGLNRASVTFTAPGGTSHGAHSAVGELPEDLETEISDYESDVESITEAVELEGLLDAQEVAPLKNRHADDQMFNLQCAAIALTLDETNRM